MPRQSLRVIPYFDGRLSIKEATREMEVELSPPPIVLDPPDTMRLRDSTTGELLGRISAQGFLDQGERVIDVNEAEVIAEAAPAVVRIDVVGRELDLDRFRPLLEKMTGITVEFHLSESEP